MRKLLTCLTCTLFAVAPLFSEVASAAELMISTLDAKTPKHGQ